MSFIYLYYIKDAISLFELVTTRDIVGLNFNNFQPPSKAPQQQLVTNSHYFRHEILSCNNFDGFEWFNEGSCQFKYLKITQST
jgi:hypothetical protein